MTAANQRQSCRTLSDGLLTRSPDCGAERALAFPFVVLLAYLVVVMMPINLREWRGYSALNYCLQEWLLLAALTAVLTVCVVRGRRVNLGGPPGLFLLMFVAFSVGTAPLAMAPVRADARVKMFILYSIVIYLIAVNTCVDAKRWKALATVIVLAMFLTHLVALREFCTRSTLRPRIGFKMASPMLFPNDSVNVYAPWVAVSAPFLVGVFLLCGSRVWRSVLAGLMVVSSVCLILLASRTPFYGFCLFLVLGMLTSRRIRKAAWPMALAGLASALLVLLILEDQRDHLIVLPALGAKQALLGRAESANEAAVAPAAVGAGRRPGGLNTLLGRTRRWRCALDMWGERPMIGVGFCGFYPVTQALATRGLSDAANMPLTVLAEQGVIGLGLYVVFVVWSLVRLGKLLFRLRGETTEAAVRQSIAGWAVLWSVILFLIVGLVNVSPYHMLLFLLLGCGNGLANARLRQVACSARKLTA